MENSTIDQLQPPKNDSPTGTALQYGLIGGAVSIALYLVLFILDMHRSQTLSTVFFIATIATFVYLAQKAHRDNDLGGYMKYGRALGVGMLTVLFMAILVAIFNAIFFAFIDPSIIEESLKEARDKMLDQDLSDDEIDTAMGFVRLMVNPVAFAFFGMFYTGGIGFIAALITGAITKRD